VSGAYRYSDYTTVGEVETYSANLTYRPSRDLLFRATYGQATRIPNLGENFAPASQTFLNNFTDPCDSLAISNTTDPVVRANLTANCKALLGPNFDPASTRIIYPSGIPGRNSGNPNLTPEESRSYTLGVAITPRFARGLSLTADYFDIKITDVIATVSAGVAANACVNQPSLNTAACATITRDPNTFRIIDFIQGSINYAATEAKGMDFTARYALNTADILGGRDLGRFDYSLRGTYLIRREDFTNIANPGFAIVVDATLENPRLRFLQTLTYTPIDRLSVSWDWDWQSSQEILDSDFLLQNPDNRPPEFLETGDYSQHDFSIRYDLTDNVRLRAGVVNAFDNDPPLQLGSTTGADIFDFFGRRFFIGANFRFGAAAD
jgi:outer membrane receptor protein involved in Fe transport